MTERTFDPLNQQTFNALAYNAIGRASEIEGAPAYALSHSIGRSGWSVGAVQWDFGQPGRGEKVADLLSGYQSWAVPKERFTDAEAASLSHRLRTPGQAGNALSATEQTRLGAYLRSDPGRQFVDSLNQQQIDTKWENVGVPLSGIEWLQQMRRDDPSQATEIVAMTSKLYNQNPNRAGLLIAHLREGEITAEQTSQWIGSQGINGLNQSAQRAILSGRDKALAGARLLSSLELSDGRLGNAWREQVYVYGNPGLTAGFNVNPNVQLLDAMMRNTASGAVILRHVDEGEPAQVTAIIGNVAAARLEMAHVTQNRHGAVGVTSPTGDQFDMTPQGWNRNGIPMERPSSRAVDMPDYMAPGMSPMLPHSAPLVEPSAFSTLR